MILHAISANQSACYIKTLLTVDLCYLYVIKYIINMDNRPIFIYNDLTIILTGFGFLKKYLIGYDKHLFNKLRLLVLISKNTIIIM